MIRSPGGIGREEERTPTLARGRYGKHRAHNTGAEEDSSDLLARALNREKQRKHGRERVLRGDVLRDDYL